jgi:hypothetical protein
MFRYLISLVHRVLHWLGPGAAVSLLIAGGGIWKFGSDLRRYNTQRTLDLRWRQAEAGKELVDEMLANARVADAFQMLDYGGSSFTFPSGEHASIGLGQVIHALQAHDAHHSATTEERDYIRACFDELFRYMAMMEHYIKQTLTTFEDVLFPMNYYVAILGGFKSSLESYLDTYRHLGRVSAFLNRFQEWAQVEVQAVPTLADPLGLEEPPQPST